MEAALGKSNSHGGSEREEKTVVLESSSIADDQEAGSREEIVLKVGNGRPCQENNEVKSSSPKQKDLSCKQISTTSNTNLKGSSAEPDHSAASTSPSIKEKDCQLESARAEMGEVREENQRLKKYLDRITEEYQTLQMQLYDIQQKANKSKDIAIPSTNKNYDQDEESELVSLSLGSFSGKPKWNQKNDKNPSTSQGKVENESDGESLSLGLDCKYEAPKSSATTDQVPLANPSPRSSLEEVPKEEAGETWPPRKVLKTVRSSGMEDEVVQQSPAKKARVSVRVRCDTPTMNDGCQWRKYGQKIAKGNPCPRAYYRCTIAPSCPVRKQVQRCAEDMSILITTYEGNHNHPLPMSATAMASTTSAAASMLLSGSSSSSSGHLNPSATATSTTAAHDLHGYNFYLSDNSKSRFYTPNSSLSSSLPTVILDLTSKPSSTSNSMSHFNKFSSSSSSSHQLYPPTSLNFGSNSESSTNMSWSNNGLLPYGTHLPPYNISNKNQSAPLSSLGIRQQPMQNNIYQNYMQKNINPHPNPPQGVPHQFQPDSIAAATKAITSDPSFQSALAAALTSIIGSNSTVGTTGIAGTLGHINQAGGGDSSISLAQKFKWNDHFPGSTTTTTSSSSPFLQSQIGNNSSSIGCASSYLNKTTPPNSQPGSLMFLPPSLPFSSAPKSASTSPDDTRDHKSL
ncbi:hypothetical protein ACFX13_039816 [Malus domestica]|uniref:WRKY domain-containing protein n=1 Tax=Malus domestica TaxID=3750 RepID=A0A498JMN9_MALDO|nr:hypothetical protein DVH24_008839 [Malus domestica]